MHMNHLWFLADGINEQRVLSEVRNDSGVVECK